MQQSKILIDEFISGITSLLQDDRSVYEIQNFVSENRIATDSLEPYLFFSGQHYTRNLIFKTKLFEVLALCWESGQHSAIHDHSGQYCWMTVPIGTLRIRNFSVVEHNLDTGYCKIAPTDTIDITESSTAAVDPTEPLHQVVNAEEFQERAVSVHVYSKPIERFLRYEPAMDRCVISAPRNFSEYGRVCGSNL